MLEHGPSAIVYAFRVWADRENYWTVYYDINESVKKQFEKKGIIIPYQQMDINLKNYDVKNKK